MDNLSILAASGLRSRMESLDLLANNLANASNNGFKSDRESYSLYVAGEAREAGRESGQSPVTLPVIESNWTDFGQGELVVTGKPLDVALSGQGLFVVGGPSGPLLTRDGSFHLSADGELVTKDGYPVEGTDGQSIKAEPDGVVEIQKDGTVFQGGRLLGKLRIVGAPSPTSGAKRQGNYFAVDPQALPAEDSGATEVRQGALEASNVSPAAAAVRLVSVLRQFESLQKALQLSGDMNRSAIDEVANPS